MSTALSVGEILAKLEARIAHHERQVAFHQQQEDDHRQQDAARAAELETVRQRFEAFKAAALPAADLAGLPVAPAAAGTGTPEDLREFVGKRIMTSKLVARVIQGFGEDETFGATRVAGEVNRRYREALKRPVDASPPSPSAACATPAGSTRSNPEARHEALYAKGRQGV